jgi:RNA polymerase sigma-70 factor (ECF subfamily)
VGEQDNALPGPKLSAEDVRALYERHGPALVAYACSFLPDAAAAEDAVHAVFVRLLRVEIETPRSPVAYVYRAVRNAALNARRSSIRESPLAETETLFVHHSGNREASLTLQRALSELPEEQREAVVMRIWSGMTLEEIAASTEVSLNTVASRYRYALEKLRERMRPFGTDRDEKDDQ